MSIVLACTTCGATSEKVIIDLDTSATPPEYVCRKCHRKPRCPSCKRRKGRLVIGPGEVNGTCHDCVNRRERDWRRDEARREAFGQAVCDLAAEDYDTRGIDALIVIPGVFDALVEYYNNAALERVRQKEQEGEHGTET
jgi:hypothetical protein